MKFHIDKVAEPGFMLETLEGNKAAFKFSGNGDMTAFDALEKFLSEVHERMIANRLSTIEVDVLDLYFMNSSCLKLFVSWIHQVQELGVPYSITLLSSSRLYWQHRSFDTLARLAPDVVYVRKVD